MRPLRRSRRTAPLAHLIPVVDNGDVADLPDSHPEMRSLHREEALFADSNAVADFAIYYFQSEPQITNALKMRVYAAAIERFSRQLPASEIRELVDCTIAKELHDREMTKRRRAEAARRKTRENGSARNQTA